MFVVTITGGRARYCLEHKQPNHVSVKTRICQAPQGCYMQAYYGNAAEKLASAVTRALKSLPAGLFHAYYGNAAEKVAIFCSRHRLPVHVKFDRRCQHPNCTRHPIFGAAKDIQPAFCSLHRRVADVNSRTRKCEHPGCLKQPSFGDPETGLARFCLTHRPVDRFVNVVASHCE
ncbi:hypothetical protein T484DRAFT_1773108, partial [Baffinella frigidus]